MAVLMYWLQEPFESELSSASFTQSITPTGLNIVYESKIAFGRKKFLKIYDRPNL